MGDSTVAAPPDRPPLKIDIFYALVTLGSSILWTLLNGWLLYFYLPPEGEGTALVPATLYGVIAFASRMVIALIAPLIGYFSDTAHHHGGLFRRWGRRLPLMFFSALPMLGFFVLFWTPPMPTESLLNLVYVSVLLLLYNLAYGFNQIPYTALLPELALTDRHRVRISAWTSGFLLVGMILSSAVGVLIDRLGYPAAMGLYAVGMLPMFYVPLFFLRERPERWAQDEAVKPFSFREDITSMLRNRAFAVMTFTGVCYWGLTTLVQAVIPYIVTEICLLTPSDTLWFYVPAIFSSLLCYPLVTWLAGRVGKWAVFAGSLLSSAFVLPGLLLIGDWMPFSLKLQGIVWVTLQAVALSGVTMLPAAFGAEIVDYDADLTGQRREGVFYATWGMLDQIINGVIVLLLPALLLLGRSHSDPNGPLGVRMVGLFGGALMLAGFFIFLRYPFRRGRGAA
ncbi:MAG: MFS transporter [Anaerolineae bacterium]|nr:MFS transporter [Anaerolineae bacterium]